MSIEELQSAVAQLPAEEFGRFSRWFEEFVAEQWDRQIEADIPAGRLDARRSPRRRGGRGRPLHATLPVNHFATTPSHEGHRTSPGFERRRLDFVTPSSPPSSLPSPLPSVLRRLSAATLRLESDPSRLFSAAICNGLCVSPPSSPRRFEGTSSATERRFGLFRLGVCSLSLGRPPRRHATAGAGLFQECLQRVELFLDYL